MSTQTASLLPGQVRLLIRAVAIEREQTSVESLRDRTTDHDAYAALNRAAADLSRIAHDLRTAAGVDPDTEVGR